MQKMSSLKVFIVVAGMMVVADNSQAQTGGSPVCAAALGQAPQWRAKTSHQDQNGEFTTSSDAREVEIQTRIKAMEDYILNYKGSYGTGDTPPFEIVPAEGVKAQFLSLGDDYANTFTRVKVTGVGPSGVLKATLLLPVSGHNGNANARKWSLTDTYTMRLDQNPAGDAKGAFNYRTAAGKEVDLITNGKSLGLVTVQDVAIPLNQKGSVLVLYYRSGSGGPGGFLQGRVIEIFWDGN